MSSLVAKRFPESIPLAFVGAGLHEVTIGLHLLDWGVCSVDQMALFDPSGEPLDRWVKSSTRMGMTEMRSPWFHHVLPETMALVDYARKRGIEPLTAPHLTPPLWLFNEFCQRAAQPLASVTYKATVRLIEPLSGQEAGYHLHLETPEGPRTVHAQNVFHTPGMTGHEQWPASLARHRETLAGRVLSSSDVDIRDGAWRGQRVLIVGAGLTGGTLALRLVDGGAAVTLIHRDLIRQRRYDVDESWMKNAGKLKRFVRTENQEERRAVLRSARRGSVTPAVLFLLRRYDSSGRMKVITHCEVQDLYETTDGSLQVTLTGQTGRLSFDRVIAATGYHLDSTQDPTLSQVLQMPEVRCLDGRPVLSDNLELLPGLFLSGWAAELRLGPQARNIIGARLAARIFRGVPRIVRNAPRTLNLQAQ